MEQELKQLKTEALAALQKITTEEALEEFEIKYVGRKQGKLTALLQGLKNIAGEDRKVVGELANNAKQSIETALSVKKSALQSEKWSTLLEEEKVDATQPAVPRREYGHMHPLTNLLRDVEQFFTSMGFMSVDGPELESDYYNFTAVNIPEDHPARDMQDTFYIKNHPHWVMRTHTSSVQVRAMQKYGAPLKMIIPGKCFRNEATDVRHEHTFYQLEGVVIDKGINFSHLKGVLELMFRHLYGDNTQIRLRPKFYPFVEPGVNVEVTCHTCKGQGCRLCKQTGWLEVAGAGMIHPHVLKEGDIDPDTYQGFAFGFGLMRLVMLKYGIDDVRLLQNGNLKFLEQF